MTGCCRRRSAADLGVEIPYATIVEYFNYLFLDQGMIHRERWLPRDGLLDRLGETIRFRDFHRTDHRRSRDHSEARGGA